MQAREDNIRSEKAMRKHYEDELAKEHSKNEELSQRIKELEDLLAQK